MGKAVRGVAATPKHDDDLVLEKHSIDQIATSQTESHILDFAPLL